MGLTKIKLLLLLCVLLSSASLAQNIRGIYVNGFDGILGSTSAENTLLNYAQGNGYNYLCLYNTSSLNLTNSTIKAQFASWQAALFYFLSRTKYRPQASRHKRLCGHKTDALLYPVFPQS